MNSPGFLLAAWLLAFSVQASAQGELETILQKYGYAHSFVPEGSRHLFKKNNLVLTLQEFNPVFQINQFAFRLLRGPVERNGRLSLPQTDLAFFTNALRRTEERIAPPKTNEIKKPEAAPPVKPVDPMAALSNSALPAKYLKSTNSGKIDFVFLDPGHGGLDPGAVAFSFFEKDLALRASFAVRSALTNRLPEVNVVMLRDKDQFVSLEDRCRMANARLRRDQNGIFVSIHLNTWFDPASRGFEVYYLSHQNWSENVRIRGVTASNRDFQVDQTNLKGLNPFDKIFGRLEVIQYQRESKMIADNVSFSVYNGIKDYVVNRGVKSERFYVLKGALMPSVLIEVGFVSSKEDLIYLSEDEKLAQMADAVAKGIEQYVKDFNQSRGFTEELF